MEEPLVAVTAHDVEDATLIVVHVHRSTAPEQHEALGDRLRSLVDQAPEASVVIVHGNGTEARHEPTQAVLDDVARRGRARGVVVHQR